ncbi:radical SAM family heme chaperone HemW [Terrisporobacter mayombei]|uniref:Heme chaperone HemW n=1 Tax=Terrisporobacter mayombei TaxID=1541 RepID=A0ABY9Q2Q0_9FIRM|nr:radical SAM family heme chaperone HemW [Terrisporobacter mayombei]MCC3867579.1 radical SAM family heme chaperone HemW [Terrisporobacter mayombei]WMT81841.1 Heme chaperone HemW [Terrisporobacter mayombei]
MLGLYVHIPFCISKCKYCDFNSYKLNLDEKRKYLNALQREMKFYEEEIRGKEIDTIFIGGGTPSILNQEEIRFLFDNIKNNFNIKNNAEITMECNPGTLTLNKLKTMKECGVNRLSIGLQAVQNNHLEYIGRIHTYEEFEKNYYQAKEVGFKNINIDLMYALPNQSKKDWMESLEKIVKLNPTHISAYSLILEEDTELFKMYERKEFKLLDEDTDIEMYEYTINYLKSHGYNQYEISNYSKEGFECKHNILYWKCENYLGLGASASGFLNETRYNNLSELNKYENIINSFKKPIEWEEKLCIKDKIEESIFLGLRMNEGIKFRDFNEKYNINFKEVYEKEINKLKKMKLIKISDEGMILTQKGREISNSVFVEFIK